MLPPQPYFLFPFASHGGGVCVSCHSLLPAGPREDIVVPLTMASNGVGGMLPQDDQDGLPPPNGFLATSVEEFTDAIVQVCEVVRLLTL
jgi:hypothetical protein